MFPKFDLRTKLALVALLILYAFAGNVQRIINSGVIQPVDITMFAGELPEDQTRFTVRFNALNGAPLAEPIYIDTYEMITQMPEGTRMAEIKHLAVEMGKASFEGNLALVEQLNDQLINYLIEFQSADYDLVLRNVYPVEKYSTDGFTRDDVLASFKYRAELAVSFTASN